MVWPAVVSAIGAGIAANNQESPEPQRPSNVHLANMGQAALWDQMARGLQGGGGDFGYGTNVKKGKSQLQDFMASRGVKMDPGNAAYAGAYGNMVGQAAGMDAQARRDEVARLLSTPLQTVQSTGGNFMPTSPSFGVDLGDSANRWNANKPGFQNSVGTPNRQAPWWQSGPAGIPSPQADPRQQAVDAAVQDALRRWGG